MSMTLPENTVDIQLNAIRSGVVLTLEREDLLKALALLNAETGAPKITLTTASGAIVHVRTSPNEGKALISIDDEYNLPVLMTELDIEITEAVLQRVASLVL